MTFCNQTPPQPEGILPVSFLLFCVLSAVRAERCHTVGVAVNYPLRLQQHIRVVANGEKSSSVFRHINSKQGKLYTRLRANLLFMAQILNKN
jgi:hypothetical protein